MPDLIIDPHLHFIDEQVHRYPVFRQRSPSLEALVGDYGALPRRYLPSDYARDTVGFDVAGTVCAEFLSDSPVEEAKWLQDLSSKGGHPSGVIALADFKSPDIAKVLDRYGSMTDVRAVRQHLAWDPSNPLLRFTSEQNRLSDAEFRKGVCLLRKHGLCCEIEVFAHQLMDFAALANSCPDLPFVLPLMGWPLDLTQTGFEAWKRDMAALSSVENVFVKIFGLESIFGRKWTVQQVRPWVLETIACFGPGRCMFASHMPIALLACSFQELYRAYLDMTSGLSTSEMRQVFHDTAAQVYKL